MTTEKEPTVPEPQSTLARALQRKRARDGTKSLPAEPAATVPLAELQRVQAEAEALAFAARRLLSETWQPHIAGCTCVWCGLKAALPSDAIPAGLSPEEAEKLRAEVAAKHAALETVRDTVSWRSGVLFVSGCRQEGRARPAARWEVLRAEVDAALKPDAGRSLLERLDRAEKERDEALGELFELLVDSDFERQRFATLWSALRSLRETATEQQEAARAECISLRSDLDVERQRVHDWQARVRRAVEQEREACAAEVESVICPSTCDCCEGVKQLAAAIRARGVEGK